MAIITRKKQLVVGTKKLPAKEVKIGKLVKITSVKLADGSTIQWRQRKNRLQFRQPIHGTLNIEFHPLELVPVGTYYPLPVKK